MGCSKPRFPKIPKTGFNSDHTILYFLCYEGYLLFKQLPYFIHQERHIHTKKNVSRSNAQRKTTYIVTLIKLRRKQSIRSRLPYSKTHRHDSEPWLTPIGRAAPSSLTTVWICQNKVYSAVHLWFQPADLLSTDQWMTSEYPRLWSCPILAALECKNTKLSFNSPHH